MKGLSHQKKVQTRSMRRAAKMDIHNADLDQISSLYEELTQANHELDATKMQLAVASVELNLTSAKLQLVHERRRLVLQLAFLLGAVAGAVIATLSILATLL